MAAVASMRDPNRVLRVVEGSKGRRLNYDEVADLRFFWTEYECAVGLRAIDYSALASLSSGYAQKYRADEDGYYVEDSHNEDTARATARGRRVRDRLERMAPWAARVLWRVYGPSQRVVTYGRFGDLSGIVEYTAHAAKLAGVNAGNSREARVRCGDHVRDCLEAILRVDERRIHESGLRQAAERLLWAACDEYRKAKR